MVFAPDACLTPEPRRSGSRRVQVSPMFRRRSFRWRRGPAFCCGTHMLLLGIPSGTRSLEFQYGTWTTKYHQVHHSWTTQPRTHLTELCLSERCSCSSHPWPGTSIVFRRSRVLRKFHGNEGMGGYLGLLDSLQASFGFATSGLVVISTGSSLRIEMLPTPESLNHK